MKKTKKKKCPICRYFNCMPGKKHCSKCGGWHEKILEENKKTYERELTIPKGEVEHKLHYKIQRWRKII